VSVNIGEFVRNCSEKALEVIKREDVGMDTYRKLQKQKGHGNNPATP